MTYRVRVYRPIARIGWVWHGDETRARTLGRALRAFQPPPGTRSVSETNARLTTYKGRRDARERARGAWDNWTDEDRRVEALSNAGDSTP